MSKQSFEAYTPQTVAERRSSDAVSTYEERSRPGFSHDFGGNRRYCRGCDQYYDRAGSGAGEGVEDRMSEPIDSVTTTSRAPIHASFLCPQCREQVVTPHRCDKDGPGEYVIAFLRDPVVRPPIVFDDEIEEGL